MSQFIDRRSNTKHKSAVNRQRFIQRFHKRIKHAVKSAVNERSIKNIDQGEAVSIPAKDLSEPVFQHGQGGMRNIVHPGNKDFITGDTIPREGGEASQGDGQASNEEATQEDEFVFQLSKQEFLDFFFDELALPNLVKSQLAKDPLYKTVKAGYSQEGVPANLNIVRSMRNALARRTAMSGPLRKKIAELEEAIVEAKKAQDDERVALLYAEIERIKQRINTLPFIDEFDLRYNNKIQIPQPAMQAVMFCIMDVSGSMDEFKKDLAKRFFILLYLFLSKNYQHIEVVFIRHHTIASEVDEETFFYSRETGGTVVSSALKLMLDIVKERYPLELWNIYAAQASDGDNWPEDSPLCRKILEEELLHYMQYFAYIEITPERHQGLWYEYAEIAASFEHFAMQQIFNAKDIYPVFHELFKKQNTAQGV